MNNYIILDGLEGDTRIYCQNCNNIARVEDEGNIVSIEGNIFLYSPKRAIKYYYYYSYRALCVILQSNDRG